MSTAMLHPTNSGNLDRGANVPAAMEARAKGDLYSFLRLLGAPEAIARRAGAFAELRNANPSLSVEMENRIVQQKLEILGVPEARTAVPSADYLRRRVAEIGRTIAAQKRDDGQQHDPADDLDDDEEDRALTTCPECGHRFSLLDDSEEQ